MKLGRTAAAVIASAAMFFSALSHISVFAAGKADSDIDTVIAGMTTAEKVAQMIMPTFRYYTDAEGNKQRVSEITEDIADILEKYAFGGVVLFRENVPDIEKTLRLTDAMQRANASGGDRPQLLISVDEEGGSIARLETGTSMPGNMALGAAGSTEYAEISGEILGKEIKAVGINMNLAPVVDINSNAANPVIGIRSFSDDAKTVCEMGRAYIAGLQKSGVISTVKHFPGHGNTDTDSHTGLPLVESTYDELKKTEFLPFAECIGAGADAVMTAHIQYPNIETGTYISKSSGEEIHLPATLSETIITDILRGDMGFDGVVITDAMLMDAIEENFDRLDAARLAINAGVDIISIPVDTSTDGGIAALGQYTEDLAALVEAGDISADNVDASVKRILSLKEKYGLLEKYDGSEISEKTAHANEIVGSDEHRATEWEIAKKAVTVVKNENDLLPLRNENETTVIMTPYDDEVLSAQHAAGRLSDEDLLAAGAEITSLSYENMTAGQMCEAAGNADNILVLSEIYSLGAVDPTTDGGEQSKKIDSVIEYAHNNGKKIIILSCFLPYDSARYTDADAFLLCYGAGIMSEDPRVAEGKVKFGANIPAGIYMAFNTNENVSGKLPVNIPVLDGNYKPTSEILYPRGTGIGYPEALYPDEESAATEESSADEESAADEESSVVEESSVNEENAVGNTSSAASDNSENPGTGIKAAAIAVIPAAAAITAIIWIKKKK